MTRKDRRKKRMQRAQEINAQDHRARKATRNQGAVPKTANAFFALSERQQDRWIRVSNAISTMRADRVSLSRAAHEFGLDPSTVVRLGRAALKKGPGGRYFAKASDRLLRVVVALTPEGKREIAVRDSRQTSLIGKHWAAVQKYLATGDASALRKIRRKRIVDANGATVRLLMDLSELDRLGSAGVLSFESLYAKVA